MAGTFWSPKVSLAVKYNPTELCSFVLFPNHCPQNLLYICLRVRPATVLLSKVKNSFTKELIYLWRWSCKHSCSLAGNCSTVSPSVGKERLVAGSPVGTGNQCDPSAGGNTHDSTSSKIYIYIYNSCEGLCTYSATSSSFLQLPHISSLFFLIPLTYSSFLTLLPHSLTFLYLPPDQVLTRAFPSAQQTA